MPTISVCIPTHERPLLLRQSLGALARQSRPPDEVVISDSSSNSETQKMVEDPQQKGGPPIKYVRSNRKALPFQRWWAFSHSTGEIILFIDDDIALRPEAIQRLVQVYEQDDAGLAGVGLAWSVEGKPAEDRDRSTFRERWLGICAIPSGRISPGGVTVSLPLAGTNGACTPVEWLSGGAMSFRRSVLLQVGPLEHLYDLYDHGIGKGEDGILSHEAARFGRLAYIPTPLATHPPLETAIRTANSNRGYKKGVLETYGRAHTMRWMARDRTAYRNAWLRVAVLEFSRTTAAILRAPARGDHWSRLLGVMAGFGKAVLSWNSIPARPVKVQPTHVE